uniref:Uncharacterized protein n=1 Tax=Ditylum brightwellii TaxID=49249 RepID=A0A7S1ZUD8_9STRA
MNREKRMYEYVPVPETDQRSALASIENSIEEMKRNEMKKGRRRNRSCRNEDKKNDTSFNKRKKSSDSVNDDSKVETGMCRENKELTRHLFGQLDRTKNDLMKRFGHLTTQLDVSEYNKVLRRNIIIREEREDDESLSSSDEDESLSSEEGVDDEEEWDEKEYIDTEALARVKSLRCKVRETSRRIFDMRENLTERVVNSAKEEIGLIREQTMSINDQGRVTDEISFCDDDTEMTDSEDLAKMEEMEKTLLRMSKTVKYVDDNLPSKIELLQETIDTIDASVDKLRKRAEADKKDEKHLDFLPRTEKAILSRSNEGRKNNTPVESDCDEKEEDVREQYNAMSPEKRFALYLLQD